MKCHYCGTELPESAIFCRHCGTRKEASPAVEPIEESIVQAPEILDADPYEFPMPKAAPVFDEETFSWKPRADEPFSDPASMATAPAAAAVIPERVSSEPRILLPTKRSLAKMIFLDIITFGIYPIVIWSRIVTELNIAASRYDGRRSMPYFGMLILSPITLGIYSLVWFHEFSNRVGSELRRRNTDYKFGAGDFWTWNFLTGLLVTSLGILLYILLGELPYAVWAIVSIAAIIGPFVYVHKLMKAMNLINADFNFNG